MNIKLVHILTEIESTREKNSILSLSPLGNLGIEYKQQINPRYLGEDWKIRPAITQSEHTNHGPGHYGAYQSFKQAFLDNFTDDLDALIVCECDCVLTCSPEEFVEKVKEGIEFSEKHNLSHFSLGSNYCNGFLQSSFKEVYDESSFYVTDKIIMAHCLVFPKKTKRVLFESLEKFSWDTPDIWFNEIFWRNGLNRFGILKEKVTIQHEGMSLIDNHWKHSQ
jgi:hypothetical protein